MALVSSQLLKQMLFLADYGISLALEVPEIKHKGVPEHGNSVFTRRNCNICLLLSVWGTIQAKTKYTMKSENCPWDKMLSGKLTYGMEVYFG